MISINGNSIQACLDNYLADEEIRVKCSECNIDVQVKQTEIIAEPSTLIIQLKRYNYEKEKSMAIKRRENIES